MTKRDRYCMALLLLSVCVFTGIGQAGQSTLVYEDGNGNLQYGTYANQGQANSVNTIPDFSSCGYNGGGVPIPFVPAAVTVNAPTGDDDTALIQDAINQVAAMSVQANGFRGAVLIKAGNYKVSTTLTINASGVVIRGEGNQATGGTRITMTATVQDNLFEVSGSGSPSEVGGTRVAITDSYVPVGATSFNVANANGYSIGDTIRTHHKINDAWITDIGMGNLSATDPADTDWTAAGYQLYHERIITGISGNSITVNAPFVQAVEDQYGGGDIFKYTFSGQLENIGFEALRLESTYTSNTDEAHGWIGVKFVDTRDGWVRQVTGKFFGYGLLSINGTCHYFTVEDCAMIDPKSITTGGRKYSFNLDDCTFVLMQRCYTWGGRHDFVSGSKTPGPNVFVDCYANNTFADVGPHHRYATGQLYDNVKCGQLRVQNRRNSGSGHGWSGAQVMFWNSESPSLICEAPTGAMNWAIGCVGSRQNGAWVNEPDGIWESHNTPVTPRSLYYRQLQERVGQNSLRDALIPVQGSGTIWAGLGTWAGEGLFSHDVVAWSAENVITPPIYTVNLKGRVRNLQMLDRGVTTTWSKVSGPGTITFGDTSALETSATFSSEGSYVIRITANDGVATATYDLNVRCGNTAPSANAGPDQSVLLGVQSPWTPAAISTAAWYDAADASTITEAGGAVSQWNDKSGNGNHASQGSAAQRPTTGTVTINGINAMSFDPTLDQRLSAPDAPSLHLDGSGGANIVAVLNYAGFTDQGSGLNSTLSKGSLLSASAAYGLRINTSGDLVFKAAANISPSVGGFFAQNLIISNVRDDANLSATIYTNGIFNTSTTTTAISSDNTDPLIIGGESNTLRYADVDFGEIIILGGLLSDSNRQKLEGYLAHKWGMTNSLSLGHPYYAAPPVNSGAAVAVLDGTVGDLDLDPLTTTWTVVSGPAAVTISNASAVDTTATFTENGTYTLRLTADDGFTQTADDVVIIVGPTGSPIVDMDLPAGISLYGYTGENPIDAQTAFQTLIDNSQLSLVRWVNPSTGFIKELYYTTFPTAGWVNEIGSLTLAQGYVVKTNVACTLSINGDKSTVSVSYDLPAGYSIIGFNKETLLDAVTVFQSLIDAGKLDVVRWVDPSNGAIKELYYTTFPSAGWVNEIGNLTEGQGYIIKLNTAHSGFFLP